MKTALMWQQLPGPTAKPSMTIWRIRRNIKRTWSGTRKRSESATYRELPQVFTWKTDVRDQIYDSNTYVKNYIYLGTAEERDARGFAKIEQKNKFSVGETIEIMKTGRKKYFRPCPRHLHRGGREPGECTASETGPLYRPGRGSGAVRYSA